jgi:hypothetical protein
VSFVPFTHTPRSALRGARDYVHSTDLYEEIVTGAAAAGLTFEGPVDLRIRAKIIHRPSYRFMLADDAPGPSAASCTFESRGSAYLVAVTESDVLVVERKPYDESPAARAASIEGRVARLKGKTGLRPIEAVTALAVHLHKTALPPPPGQRWMLGQLSLKRPLAESESQFLELRIDRLIGETTSRTRISASDGAIGTMIFILAAG